MLAASILLGIMILPTIIGVSESAIRAVPNSYYEGSLALGADHERSVFFAVLPAAKSGSLAGVVDAETMATPLSYMKAGEALPQYFTLKSMFLGTMPGCLGEVSALALLIGGV